MVSQPDRPDPRLYLVTPPTAEPGQLCRLLAPALAAADIAAVLLRLEDGDERTLINRVKAIAPVVQNADVALILDGRPQLVARAGADGAHLTGIEAFDDAVEGLKPERIAGASGLDSRHDAMLAAERGADYVMFGEPDAGGHRPSFESILDRVGWWAEVFQVPCVAFAAAADEVAPLAQAGADFVAIGDYAFADPRGLAAALGDAMQALASREPA
ncbi:MAG: thiamine phosphate synthase [Pseudorhodoplanes sp.]|nr:thiamine phosphate synthase [Pseudorhodoplanes sp.]